MTPPDDTRAVDFPPTEKTRIKRLNEMAYYDRETVYAVLDAGLICHVGYVIDGQPYVTPTAYWREGEQVYWHGSSASRMLRQVKQGIPVCLTVALLDGLVLARSGYNSSINYRSVVAFGTAREVTDREAKLRTLEAFSERITPGRWPELRPATDQELKATTVLTMKLEELACKVQAGPPVDNEEDYDFNVWAGVLPIHTIIEPPEADPRLKAGFEAPDYHKTLRLG